MLAKVQNRGDSLVVRIPKTLARDAHLKNGSLVEVSVVEGQIMIKAIETSNWKLEELLAGINKNNVQQKINTGSVAGNEIW